MNIKPGQVIDTPDGLELKDWVLSDFHWPPTEAEIEAFRDAVEEAEMKMRLKDCFCTGDRQLCSLKSITKTK